MIFEATLSGHSFEIAPADDGKAFVWSVTPPGAREASVQGETPDIDSAYAAAEGVVRRQGGLIIRRSSIVADIRETNPGLSDAVVEHVADLVTAEILGA